MPGEKRLTTQKSCKWRRGGDSNPRTRLAGLTVFEFEVSPRRLPHPSDANLRNPCKYGKSSSAALHRPQASVSSSAPKWHQLRHQHTVVDREGWRAESRSLAITIFGRP